jgi:hypothetical protein
MNIAPGLGAGAAKPGLISGMLGSLSPQGQAAAITVGGQLTGGLIQGVGARQEQKRQEQMAADQKATYNTNIGTRLWG